MDQSKIRNFCIIAHIDHGKSTLADRLLELTGTVEKRQMKAQVLDRMELERERGITIKLAPVRMKYKDYELNLIDTPGHVDFSYEVSRSLAAVEGAILVVDASQGIQAQTLANVYLALTADLKIIPVLNKIDLPSADPDRVSAEIISLLDCKQEDILEVSAKTGQGVKELLDQIVSQIPSPNKGGLYKKMHPELFRLDAEQGDNEQRASRMHQELAGMPGFTGHQGQASESSGARALIFDSYYDDYRGVILYLRMVDGQISKSDQIKMVATGASGLALEVGSLNPAMEPAKGLSAGEVGYMVTNLKTTRQAKVGDTVTLSASQEPVEPLPGYRNVTPFVYAGFFPDSHENYQLLKDAVERLAMSDSALAFTPENSPVLGFGFRIGFLGLLHMDIVKERLTREYNLELIVTNPSTDYKIKTTKNDELDIKSAAELPDMSEVAEIAEPWVKGEIVAPSQYVGVILQLVVGTRGAQKHISYMDNLAVIDFEAPLANLLTDFYDQLKSVTSGYGSFNYELADYRVENLVRLDFYIAGEKIDALAVMTHRSESERLARQAVAKLKEVIPRQNFKVAIQAGIGGKFIAREDISAYRKDVTSGLYGGDVSRKKKVLAKQKRGKQRLKKFGKVDIPAEAFAVMLRRD